MIFYFGFILMVLNEGFVILRHAIPYLAEKRQQLINRYGVRWQYTHSLLDTLWIVLIVLGFAWDFQNWRTYLAWLLGFWGLVGMFYLTVFWDRMSRK
jgi:hypothetical protein